MNCKYHLKKSDKIIKNDLKMQIKWIFKQWCFENIFAILQKLSWYEKFVKQIILSLPCPCIIIFYSLGNMHSRMNYAKAFLKYNYYFKELFDICSHNWTWRYLIEIFTTESREPKAISKRYNKYMTCNELYLKKKKKSK